MTTEDSPQQERAPFPPSARVFLSQMAREDSPELLRRTDALAELVEHPGWGWLVELAAVEAAHQAAPRRHGMQLAAAIVANPGEVASQIAAGAAAAQALHSLIAVAHDAVKLGARTRAQIEGDGGVQ